MKKIYRRWLMVFLPAFCQIYAPLRPATKQGDIMKLKTRLLIGLVVLAVVDMVIPIPFTALLLLYVVLEKPPWFQTWASEVYKV
jgi:hypothetical protein